jgi:hypothetical protein
LRKPRGRRRRIRAAFRYEDLAYACGQGPAEVDDFQPLRRDGEIAGRDVTKALGKRR